jgi:hypothetical protein
MSDFTEADDVLLNQLGLDTKAPKKSKLTAQEERIVSGFEEIQRFVSETGKEPEFGEDKDVFENIYATRLEKIRQQENAIELLKGSDHQNLLSGSKLLISEEEDCLDDETLLRKLDLLSNNTDPSDITKLKFVKPRAEINAAKEIGQRTVCKDFEAFKPIITRAQRDLNSGKRKVVPFSKDSSIEEGNLFILSGQLGYVAEVGEPFIGVDGRNEHRLRVIFDNGVESNQLMHSLQKRLWDDKTSRRITDPSFGPLFDGVQEEGEIRTGTVYVCRSHSTDPYIVENREVIHKIGVTTNSVESRLRNAKNDPTFLFAEAELVYSLELYRINPQKLESLLQSFFSDVRLKVKIPDRFGKSVSAREWFLVPVEAIKETVQLLKKNKITDYRYNRATAALEKIKSSK